jgi:hypothetical protein
MVRKNKTIILIIILIAGGFVFYKTRHPDKVWVKINPIKCLGNAWEFDWLKNHPGKYNEYPKSDEKNIVTEFYNKQGIKILDVSTADYKAASSSCQGCSCSDGYTLKLLVRTKDAETMRGWGYTN